MNKQTLKEELVDLRMKLAEAEMQANKIIGKLPSGYGLDYKARNACLDIQKADDEIIEIAKLLGLDKLDVVKLKELSNAK